MNTLAKVLASIPIFTVMIAPGALLLAATPAAREVLVLLPFQPDLPVSRQALDILRQEFAGADGLELTVYYEFMDSNRFSDNQYQQALLDLYTVKYRGRPLDLVLVETETVLDFWLSQRDSIAPAAPVVYFDTLTGSLQADVLPADVTGVSGVLDYTPTFEWLQSVRPDITDVVVVHGVGPVDLVADNIQPIEEFSRVMGQRFRVSNLSTLPFAEIKQRVAGLPSTAVVLSHPVFEDAAGTNLDPAAVLRELVEVSPVPVITGFDISIGSGTIGGNMYSLEQQARQAVQLALRILRGEADAAIPPPLNSGEGVFMFDHAALQRFDIPLSALPPGSVVVNQQPSAWELYRPQIVATVAGILGLLLLVAFLLRLTRKLNQTRLTLAQLNENLEAQVQERTSQLHNANRKLLDEIGERKLLEDELQRHASTDVLTGISNRRHFLELIQREIKHANRFDYPLALAMIDLDRFKQLNDRHGHAAGDTALIAFVEVCRHNIREIDLLARFGGDEFVLLMPNTDCDQAALVVEHVRKALEQHSLPFFSDAERLTISVGITTLAHAREPIETLLIRADAALYEAKAQGRNRIVIAAASVAAD